MKTVALSLPTFGFVLGTRAALAFGVGLLVSSRIPESRRRTIGMALVAFGAATTFPAVRAISASLRRSRRSADEFSLRSPAGRDRQLVGTERFPRKGDDD